MFVPAGEHSMEQIAASADVDSIQSQLVAIWTDVLRVTVAPTDDFFELGGDSISAFEVINSVQELLDVALSIQAVYRHTTIPQLAAEVARLQVS